MRDLWNELVNSVGFVVSAVVVIILLPMMFFAFMGAFSDPEATLFLIIMVIAVVCFFVYMIKTPTLNEKDDRLWAEEKAVEENGIRKDKKGRFLETSVEYEERINVRKREHFQYLFGCSQIRNLFYYGVLDKPKGGLITALATRIENFAPRLKNRDYLFELERISWSESAKDPYILLRNILDYAIKRCGYQSRDYIEKNMPEVPKKIMAYIMAAYLTELYTVNKFATTRIDEDYGGYCVVFPIGEPICYRFDCTKEEEQKFFEELKKHVYKTKRLRDKLFYNPNTPLKRHHTVNNHGASFTFNLCDYSTFDWRLDADKKYADLQELVKKESGF